MLRAQLASKKELLCARTGPQGQAMGAEMSCNRAMGCLKKNQSRGQAEEAEFLHPWSHAVFPTEGA